MREIKFRGRKVNTTEWIIGNLSYINEDRGTCGLIVNNHALHIVDLESVGQFTGLKDKNGIEIYGGDLFRWDDDAIGVIKYRDGSFYLETNIALPGDSAHAPGIYSPWLRVIKHELENELETIGNVYEHKHLLTTT